jgi:hypothetical protein
MSPSHSRKGGARYGYYVSSALIQGQPQSAGSAARVPAAKIEAVVRDAVHRHIGDDEPTDDTELITTHVRQIEVRRTEIAISLLKEEIASEDEQDNPPVLGAATIDGIASREACSKRHVNMTISLAFLAPSLIKAAVEGGLPHGIGVARLFDAPVSWSRQHQILGLVY